tara:strand:+ start:156 stop:551 length:396 start_codon:yes stop_codon:yes gene_type:complete
MRKRTKSRGLGDTIEKITKATGIKKVVDKISKATGKACNCDKRKEALNNMFPYNEKSKLSRDDYLFLKDSVDIESYTQSSKLSSATQRSLLDIYNRSLKKKKTFTNCSPCAWVLVSKLKELTKEYETLSTT